jgi:hypothetical protein
VGNDTPTAFENYTWQGLIDYGIGRGEQYHHAATVESARRIVAGQKTLEGAIERLITSVDASSESADKFAAEAQWLNRSIRAYTIAMFVLAALQFIGFVWTLTK